MTRIQKNNPVSRFRLVSGLIRISLFFVFFCCVLSANGSREIKVGVNANMKPFQFVNSDGELSGLHIDLFDKLAEKKGWDVYYILFDDNEKSYEALATVRSTSLSETE